MIADKLDVMVAAVGNLQGNVGGLLRPSTPRGGAPSCDDRLLSKLNLVERWVRSSDDRLKVKLRNELPMRASKRAGSRCAQGRMVGGTLAGLRRCLDR